MSCRRESAGCRRVAAERVCRTGWTKKLAQRFGGRTLDIDRSVATRWGELLGRAETKGKKIPVIDGLLAATALEAELTVVTENVEHFRESECPVLNPWQR